MYEIVSKHFFFDNSKKNCANSAQLLHMLKFKQCMDQSCVVKDTINDFASLNFSTLQEIQTNELSKTTRIVVVHSFGISKRLQDGTEMKKTP